MNHAILAKSLYLKAIESYLPSEEVSRGLTISLSQDAYANPYWPQKSWNL